MPPGDDTQHVSRAGVPPSSLRGAAGYFRAARDDAGRWWLLDPAGQPCFVRGVHGVAPAAPRDDAVELRDCATRLGAWGFNALGVGADAAARTDERPFLGDVELSAAAPIIVAPGVRLPDVFDPEWPRLAAMRAAERCAPLRSSAELIGWVTDSALQWGFGSGSRRPGLLQTCLSLEPSFAAYHAAWEFVLAAHGGGLDALGRAWSASLPNKEALRELTRAETGVATRGYWRDDALWTREFARRYFSVAGGAVRDADANHLIFGCRFQRGGTASEPAGANRHVLAACVYPSVDVAMPGWRELPEDDTMPVLPEVDWAQESFWAATGTRDRRLTDVERMLRRARAGLARLAQHRAVVGYLWAQWRDSPADRPPFGRGLVHVDDSEAREHTELLASFNARAESLRGKPKAFPR